ncbi:hypothetical protein QE152_g36814 [Popillia japonica]|uniref:Uncharacterized protein n=1 Tax=Popillia japonica TaxID=7064 RepID=A0AAW1IC43_POPJA
MTGRKQQCLSHNEILEFWENFSGLESEDDADESDSSDIDDPIFAPESNIDHEFESDSNSEDDTFDESDNIPEHTENNSINVFSDIPQDKPTSEKKSAQNKRFTSKNINWKAKSQIYQLIF